MWLKEVIYEIHIYKIINLDMLDYIFPIQDNL